MFSPYIKRKHTYENSFCICICIYSVFVGNYVLTRHSFFPYMGEWWNNGFGFFLFCIPLCSIFFCILSFLSWLIFLVREESKLGFFKMANSPSPRFPSSSMMERVSFPAVRGGEGASKVIPWLQNKLLLSAWFCMGKNTAQGEWLKFPNSKILQKKWVHENAN